MSPQPIPLRVMAGLIVALLATASVIGPAQARPADARERTVQVMSYNIHHGQGIDGVLSLERIAAEITAADAEVVGLQEVDNHWGSRSEFVDQARWLAERLGMAVVFGANLDLPPAAGQVHRRQYGTAVLSAWPIIRSHNTLLTNLAYPSNPTEQRGVLSVTINVRGALLEVHNTHFDHQRAEQRDLAVTETLALLDRTDRPALLLGDLNAEPEAPEIRRLTAALTDAFAGRADAPTYPTERPTKRIDFLLGRHLTFAQQRVISTPASDHLPVTASVTFRARPRG